MSDDNQIFTALSSGENPGGIYGFPKHVRGIFVATFVLFLLWFLALLIKFLINTFSGRQGGPESGQLTPFQRWRMQQSGKGSKVGQWMGGNMAPPPPPQAQFGPGQGQTVNASPMGPMQGQMGQGGPMAPIDQQYPMSDGTQGMNSQIGTPYDSRSSEALSRAADVFWRGFITLLFVAVINALSFDLDDSGSTANILSWIFMALIIIWGLLTLFIRSRLLPVIMILLSYPAAIASIAVAFNT